jgi:hypothetical protein
MYGFDHANFEKDWFVPFGNWFCLDNCLVGKNPQPTLCPLISKREFSGNILMDFHAKTILPATHDIDAMWQLDWNSAENKINSAYIAGIEGWWDGKIGIEKAPDYKLVAAVPSRGFTPGKEYHIQLGTIDGRSFIFVDGILQIELFDPDPIEPQKKYHIGFEAYQTMISISELTVYQVLWKKRSQQYTKEF